MSRTLNASDVDASDLEQVATLTETLPQGSPLVVAMQHLVAMVRKGQDVTVLTSDEHLTPNQAADLLHVSRPYLLKFMDNGELDFYRVGNRRRLRMTDLLDFIARRERAKTTVASAFGNPELAEQALRDGGGRTHRQQHRRAERAVDRLPAAQNRGPLQVTARLLSLDAAI